MLWGKGVSGYTQPKHGDVLQLQETTGTVVHLDTQHCWKIRKDPAEESLAHMLEPNSI